MTTHMVNPQMGQQKGQKKRIQTHIKSLFLQFLQNWQKSTQKGKYIKKAQQLLQNSRRQLLINRSDIFLFNHQLSTLIFNNYYRYQHLLNECLTQFMKQVQKNLGTDNSEENQYYQVAFDKGFINQEEQDSVRNLKSQMLGKLKSVVGTVTRVSQVRPELVVGTFRCNFCGKLSQKIQQQFKYTTPKKCRGEGCLNNFSWELYDKQSLFADFQKLRLQQDSSKIPPGSMPRSIDVILRNQNIERGQPGDQVHVVGYLSVMPELSSMIKPGQKASLSSRDINTRGTMQEGVKGVKGVKQLNYKLCFIGTYVYVMNNQFNEDILTQQQQQGELTSQYNKQQLLNKLLQKFNQDQIMQIKRIKQNPRIYQHMSQSLFHEIFGHSQIKKALLLMLLGGLHKKTGNKISLRGDINILIVGDPSTAKSQFLKCVNKFVPRSVYTNGKTTSAAGLTASVVRDQDTGNVSIEAGALLLADNGVCCIDQFDKMEIKDQVAIHEAMEQQTISIAKAGIQATLHARTSILAAANPLFGRYDKSQSLRKNINISPPIMSRFDLYFIICDEANEKSDQRLSEFIINMHQDKKQPTGCRLYNMKQIRNYLSVAKKIKPQLNKQAANQLRRSYIQLRKRDKMQQNIQYQVTVRQLESLIRLSQALAKLHLDLEIKTQYVREAFRLLECSMVKLEKSAIELADNSLLSNNQKLSIGLSQFMNPQNVQKKQKKIIMDHNVFQSIKRSIEILFQEKQERHRQATIQQVQLYLSFEDLIAYLMINDLQDGSLEVEESTQKTKQIYKAILNKLIKQDMLAVIIDSDNISEKKLALHPNYQISTNASKP